MIVLVTVAILLIFRIGYKCKECNDLINKSIERNKKSKKGEDDVD